MKIFSVYDSKAEYFMQPMFIQSTGQAIRMFQDTTMEKDHLFSRHPADFTLFEIGEFDEKKGLIKMKDSKINLGTALENMPQQEIDLQQPDLEAVN